MAQILLLKAKLRGDTETSDLFAMTVPVKGHMRGQIYVAPTTAIRHKAAPAPALVRMMRHAPTETITSRSKMVPTDQVEAERARGWRTGDEQRPEPDPAERLAQIDRHIEARAKAGEPPLPKLAEMRDKMAESSKFNRRHAEAYEAREAIHARMTTAAWEQVEALADGARALSDQMEDLARDHQAKLAARAGVETSGADVQRELEDMRARLARYDARGVSKEPLAAIYRARLSANPDKWKPGQGVSYGVVANGRYAQRNRGFRVVGVDPAGLRLAVRQVADTGFADARPGSGRDQWVWMGDAKRDTAHDL